MTDKAGSLAELNRRANADWFTGVESSPRHSSLAALREYDSGYADPEAAPLYYVRALLLLSVVYLLWVAFHESVHYASCTIPGNSAYVASVLPTPTVACVRGEPMTPYGAFVYYMSPYIATIIVLAVFSGMQSGMLRLIPYTAFFDLQYNLFATSVLGGAVNGRENDVLSLMQHLDNGAAPAAMYHSIYGAAVAFLVGASLLVFYYGYRDDLSDTRYRGLFTASFLFYTAFYASGTFFLYC